MKRPQPGPVDLIARLMAIKTLVRGMGGAMPSLAAEMRREACEALEDLIAEVS